jgi:hypothetical protein
MEMELDPFDMLMVIIKYLKDEKSSSVEFQLDKKINSLNNIVFDNLHSRFVSNHEKSLFFMQFDTSQMLIMDILKGMKYFGWSLMTSNAFCSPTSLKTVETYFYFERHSSNENLRLLSLTITPQAKVTSRVSNIFNNQGFAAKNKPSLDTSNHISSISSANNSMMLSPTPTKGFESPRGDDNPDSSNSIGNNDSFKRGVVSPEIASILLAEQPQSGPYGFAKRSQLLNGCHKFLYSFFYCYNYTCH